MLMDMVPLLEGKAIRFSSFDVRIDAELCLNASTHTHTHTLSLSLSVVPDAIADSVLGGN